MQLRTEAIVVDHTPLPSLQREYFMVSLNIRGGTVRPRTVEFLLTEQDARALWGLRKGDRLDTQFSIRPSGRRCGFLSIDQVHFDQGENLLPVYQVAQVHRITKFTA